jgi:inner membrane protein YidH
LCAFILCAVLRTFQDDDEFAAGLNETGPLLAPLASDRSPSENVPVGVFDWKYASSVITSAAEKEMLMTNVSFLMRRRTKLHRPLAGNVHACQSSEVEVDASIKEKLLVDLRDYLAEERTFLAWVRTGIALMGFGLVVIAHFELFADEPHITQRASGLHPHGPSLWFGTALVAIGVAVNLVSAQRFMRLVGELNRDRFLHRSLSMQGVVVALLLALLGIAMTIYLTLFQPDALHA